MISASYTILLLCGPVAAVAAVWLAERIGVPYPILLVGVGWFLSWLPWTANPEIPPQLVFYVFLPPLVYYAALFVAPDDLRAHARLIVLLAVGLVVVTAAAVAGVLVGAAGLPLAVALVAGVVVAPTDTVSATSVFKRLNAPEDVSIVVEGEGLTNDGAALVLYEGAVATVVAGAVRPGHLVVTLVAAPAGGAALGLAIAWLVVKVRRRMNLPLLEITVSLATPYLTYASAQAFHLSGVLATVAAGIYVGSHLNEIYAPTVRLQAFAFLDVLVFLLNALIFTLLGMQFDRKVHWLPGKPALETVAVISAAVVVVIVMRLIWMLIGPVTARLLGRAVDAGIWRERVVLGWAGMRGGVSLAAALAIPFRRADGSPFPERNLVILVAGAVIMATMLMQGMTLPWLLRRLGLRARKSKSEENEVRLQAARAALASLEDHTAAESPDDVTESVRPCTRTGCGAWKPKLRVIRFRPKPRRMSTPSDGIKRCGWSC